jgi:tetratricopeptide (TPR) repeat protein
MRLRARLRASVAVIAVAGLVAPGGLSAETPPAVQRAPGSTLGVNVAQSNDLSRIEFRFPGAASYTAKRDGQTLVLHFSKYLKPDMTRLRVDPPKFLKSAADRDAGGLEITLNLADGADAKVGQADGVIYVNLFAAAQANAQAAPPDRPNPVPDTGVVEVAAQVSQGQLVLHFPWKAPLGAAVFHRGTAIWIVFDASARLDLSPAALHSPLMNGVQVVQGAGFTVLRINGDANEAVAASAEGADWMITLSDNALAAPDAVKISRDETTASGALSVAVAGATRVLWVPDPVVGDKIGVVTALAPAKGLPSRREYVDLALLPSAQGLAVEPIADDISITTDGDLVAIGRPLGLALSTKNGDAMVAQGPGLPQPATRPGLVDFDNWSKTGSGGFVPRYAALQTAAAEEAGQGQLASMNARMGLARFLVGSELDFEAIGLLDLLAKQQPNLLGDPEFRGLRGAAKAMAGRYKEAQTDFSVPILSDDPASSLWRGYIDAQLGQWSDARGEFQKGAPAFAQFNAKWRARFARADARAALALNANSLAEAEAQVSVANAADPAEQLASRLVQAQVFEAEGQKDRALGIYQVIARVNLEQLAAPALLHATEIRRAEGAITPVQAADTLDGLRYRWRGDATELDTIRELAQIYLSLGRYREALDALRSAGQHLPDLPEAVALQNDLTNAFRGLFLEGEADGLQPVQALALFYDFKDLTPIGADGDLIVRKLARRLVDVDLLGQAAELLKYQEENRLDGVPRAEVATDLATIDLMNRQPEAALDALNESRSTVLPTALTAQRRVVESRAWLMLGQYDHAMEIIQGDKGNDAASIRADVAWRQHEWAGSAAQLEALLGDRWKNTAPLTTEEEGLLLRCAISLSLANDDAGLARLRAHYQSFVDHAQSPDALRVALAGLQPDQATSADFARAAAESDTFVGWVQAMKQRFQQTSTTQAAAPKKG